MVDRIPEFLEAVDQLGELPDHLSTIILPEADRRTILLGFVGRI
jgi:hypothetical protein